MTLQNTAINDVTGPLLDAYRAMEGLLHDAGHGNLADLLHVLNQRLDDVIVAPGISGGHS